MEIEVAEHVPVAVVQTGDGFVHVAAAGAVVQRLEDPTGWVVIAGVDHLGVRVGDVVDGPALPGALEFVVALPPDLAAATLVTIGAEGQLSAAVGGHDVRLGRPIDMGPKAAALVALIELGLEPGSIVDVTAPRRPAVGNPQAEVEG